MKSLYKKASTKSSIVGDPTKPYHPVTNPDGYFPMQNTRADSLALYKNALLKDSFYENNSDYVKETNPLTDFRDNSFRDRIIREVMSPALPASINPVVSQPLIDDVKRRSSSFTKKLSSSEEKAMQNKLGETRFGPVPGTNLYQFGDILINDMNAYYNPLAPPIYLHPHIKPQGSNRYYSERFSDRTEVPYYDPIAIAPVDILNDEQLKKRIKKYGKDSVPQSVYTRLNRNQDIKPMPTLDASKYLTSERPAPIAQSVKYEHDPTWGKNLYIQFKDPKQSTRTSQEIFHFGDWGTFMEFNDALRNAGRMFNTFSSNAKKNQGSASYGGTTKEEAMEIYKQYTTPKTGYRTGGIFKDPPVNPIPSGVNVFATSNSIYKAPYNPLAPQTLSSDNTTNKIQVLPSKEELAYNNIVAAINNKKPDALKQDKSMQESSSIANKIQLGLDAAQFVPHPLVSGSAYLASLPFTTYDVTQDLYKRDYKQAGLDALGYIPAFKAYKYGLKGNKILDTTSKLAKQLAKVNTVVNTLNLAVDAEKEKERRTIDGYKKGGLIKRADGSYSQRGLWDNIRANRGSGKEPTKQMLEQEKKIKAKYQNGGLFKAKYSKGGITSLNDLNPKTMAKYIADLKNQENDAKKGYTNSRWYPHASVEGGSDTIAYGHKILPNEDFSKGLSDYEAEQLLQRDVLVHQAHAKKQIDDKYGEGTFNSLPQDRQMLLVDYDYNLGSLSKFPNFVDAAVKGNNEKMLKEYVRYSGGKPLKKRNDWSLNVINNMSQPVYSRIPPPDNLFKHLSLPVDNLIIKKTIL